MNRLERVRSTNDLSVGQMTLTELQAEVRRRVQNLIKQRDELRERLAVIERELEKVAVAESSSVPIGNINGGGGKKRMSADDYGSAVRDRTRTTYCHVRDATLCRLPEYHSDEEEETTTKDSWARKIEVAEPKAKRSKQDGETKPTKPPGGW